MGGGGSTAADVGTILAGLPAGFRRVEEGGSWFVVGPTGAFVVACARGDVAAAAHRARTLAVELRARLDRTLGWSPFVDALVVAEHEPVEGATRVPPRLLRDTIAFGPLLLDGPWVEAIAGCLGPSGGTPAARTA